MDPFCHESKLPWIHFAMNPNDHGSMFHCAPFGMNRTYKWFLTSTSMHVHGKSQVITMPVRSGNTYNRFSPKCLLTLEHLKGVHFLQTDINTEYNHIASYQYEAARIWKGVLFFQLDMNTGTCKILLAHGSTHVTSQVTKQLNI